MMTQPSRKTFWRLVLAVVGVLSFLSIWQLLMLAVALDVHVSSSRSWMGALVSLGALGTASLLALAFTWSRYRESVLSLLESPERVPGQLRWIGWPFLAIALVGFTLFFMVPFTRELLGGQGWVRFLIFLLFSLLGSASLKTLCPDLPWMLSLVTVVLIQASLHLIFVYLTRITDYPFALGWSETSRYYYPSLFLSKNIYGESHSWPILHPTLHLLLTPPYWFNASLWGHRLWEVLIRLVLVGAVVPALLKRISIHGYVARGLVALWMFLFLFMGPIYFHLAVVIVIILAGYSSQSIRSTWMALVVASVWSGLSRINWYPMPGLIMTVLYVLEVPYRGKSIWKYLLKPTFWFVIATGIAFASQRVYIFLSGNPDPQLFYTSLTSDLLWYRLWPNASYEFGMIPAAITASIPIFLAIFLAFWPHRRDWHPVRVFLIAVALLVLFAGGIIVSLKIGGGANLHNMDAFFSLLIIVFAYIVFARYRGEDGNLGKAAPLHWIVVILLIALPAWSWLKYNINFRSYDHARTEAVLERLQTHVDQINARGGEILFITQRHLISMHMLDNVELVAEYEREELMEMAMSNNTIYLDGFQDDIENQRFAMIVVDPLKFKYQGSAFAMGEENDAWVRWVVKSVLCNYEVVEVFAEDKLAVYVPQNGERTCP